MKKIFLFLGISFLLLTSCSQDEVTQNYENSNNGNKGALLCSTSLFSCYKAISTKSIGGDSLEIITTKLLPSDVDIVLNKNTVDNKKKFNYQYTADLVQHGDTLNTIYINIENREDGLLATYQFVNSGDISKFFFPKNGIVSTKSWGQDSMDCLQDVYSRHGWLSVFVTIESAYIPATVGVFAAACAIKNF